MLGMTLNQNIEKICAITGNYAVTNESIKISRKKGDYEPASNPRDHRNMDDYSRLAGDSELQLRLTSQGTADRKFKCESGKLINNLKVEMD